MNPASLSVSSRRLLGLGVLAAGLLSGCAHQAVNSTSAGTDAKVEAAPALSAEDRNSFFVHAARTGAIDELRKYLDQGAEIDGFDTLDQTALIAAIDHNHIDIVRLLLDRGANVQRADQAGWTPLIHSIYFGGNAELLNLLIDRGADVNARNDRGVTAIYLAAASGREEQVELLLKRGADAKLATKSGYTPIRIAQLRGYARIVALLEGKPLPSQATAEPTRVAHP